MQDPVNREATGLPEIPFKDVERGVTAGLWYRSEGGHEWRTDLVPVVRDQSSAPREGPWLVPRGVSARRYPVFRREGLLDSFVRLADAPTREATRRFADRFGLLGHGTLLRPPGEGPAELGLAGEHFADWLTATLQFRDTWSLWRAITVLRDRDGFGPQQCRIAQAVIDDRFTAHSDGRVVYQSRTDGPDGAYVSDAHVILHPQTREYDAITRSIQPHDMIGLAAYDVSRRINDRIRGMSPHLIPFRDFVIRYAPDSLETAIWFRFALTVSGEAGRQVPCAHCRTPFVQTRRNRRYCTPACQSAARYRRVVGSIRSGADA